MIAKDFLPRLPLSNYISQYRLRHFVFANGITPSVKPFPPRPEQCLTFYVRGTETSRYLREGVEITKTKAVVSGQFTQRVDRYVSYPEILMIIVDFKPGALYHICGIPFSELVDKEIDAELIFAAEIKRVNYRLSSTASYSEMLRIVEKFLIETIQRTNNQLHSLDQLLTLTAKDYDHSIDWLARCAYLSPRQLERKFYERVGVSPKTFLRISRFNHSYWMHLKNPHLSWFQIAMSCGYTDYQHMVKEYNEFANNNPIKFFAEESKAPGRILGLNKS